MMTSIRLFLASTLAVMLAACSANSGPGINTVAAVTGGFSVTKSVASPPVASLAVSPHAVSVGQTAIATWDSAGATLCTGGGGWSGDLPLQNTAGLTIGPIALAGTYTYTVTCTGPGGTAVASDTLSVGNVPAPVIEFTVAPLAIQPGNSATIIWSTTNASACTGSGGTGSDGWSSAQATSNIAGFNTQPITTAAQYPYSLTCTGPGGTSEQTAILTVSPSAPPAPPVVSFSATPTVIESGESTQFTWNTGNDTACAGTGGTPGDNWAGSQPVTSSGTAIGPLTATGDFAFTLTCSGPGGTTSKTVNVQVDGATAGAAIDIQFAASPVAVTAGGSAALTWSTTNATGCTADGSWSGAQPLSGSGVSTGTLTTPGMYSYTLNCVGAGGSQAATATASVTVNAASPVIGIFTALPTSIGAGGTTTLTWNSTGATSCTASGGTGADGWGGSEPVASSGTSVRVSTAGSYTYTLTCTGPGGTTAPASTLVTATGAATVASFEATPSTLVVGGASTLTWSTNNATSCVATGGNGSDSWPGTYGATGTGTPITFASAGTFTYTLNCSGTGGASGPVSVTVNVASTPPAADILSFTATPGAVQVGTPTQLAWTSSDATGCTESDGTSGWGGATTASSSGTAITIAAPGTYTFALTCTGTGGTSAPASLTVTATTAAPTPTITSFTAVPSSIQTNQSASLAWSTSGATACQATGGTGQDQWTGSPGTSSSGFTVGPIATAGTYLYTLTCTGAGGTSVPSQLTLTVTTAPPPASIGSLTAVPTSLLEGQSTQLSWSSSNATSCTAGGGTGTDGWNGSVGTSSTGTTVGPLNAAGTFVYSLTCAGAGGSSSPSSVTVTVNPPPAVPTVAGFTATPTTLTAGGSSTLAWSSTGATSCTAGGGSGGDNWSTGTVATSSAASVVSPTTTTTYTLSCSGPGGTSPTSSVTVTVNAAVAGQPTVTLTVNGLSSAQIAPGAAPILGWVTTNTATCTASGGASGDGWNGTSEPLTSSGDTLNAISTPGVYSYTLTCTGTGGGSSSSTVTLTVISASGANCGIGEASTLLETPAATASWSQLSGVCVLGCGVFNLDNLIDSNANNFATVYTTVGLGVTLELAVSDQSATFPAGRTVGFLMADNGSLLSLSLLGNLSVVTLLGSNVQETATVSNLLTLQALGTLYDPDAGFVAFKTTKPFNSVALVVNSLASVGSTFKVYGACATLQ